MKKLALRSLLVLFTGLFLTIIANQAIAEDKLWDPTAQEIKPIVPKPVVLNSGKTALLVLEMSEYNKDPKYFCAPLVPGINRLLEKARAVGIPICYTVPKLWEGKPYGAVYSGFNRRPNEPVFLPPGFDKFSDGKMHAWLQFYGVDTLIMVGGKANMAIMISATIATSFYKYKVVIPLDGIAATTKYEMDYTLYEFRAYPNKALRLFSFPNIDTISFQAVTEPEKAAKK